MVLVSLKMFVFLDLLCFYYVWDGFFLVFWILSCEKRFLVVIVMMIVFKMLEKDRVEFDLHF